MAEFFDSLNEKHIDFINNQLVFFVASATDDSRVNLSPKGMDSFRVLSPNQAAYLDVTGSGNETAAHLRHNPRLTFMFCSFAKQPLILRLYGQGRAIQPRHEDWHELIGHFPPLPGTRQIIVMDIDMVQTSCGYAVPTAENMQQRDTLLKWANNKGEAGIHDYWKEKNLLSLDGLETGLLEELD